MTRTIWIKMSLAATLSILVFLFLPEGNAGILYLAALPLTLAAGVLRSLSLSGSLGNAAAIVLYAAICLSPLLPLLPRRNREDWLLVLASLTLFYVMYLLINPALMPKAMGNDVGAVIYSGVVYSIFLTWAVLKILPGEWNGYRALKLLLGALAVVSIVAGFGVGTGELKENIMALHAANTMPGQNLFLTDLFYGLLFTVQALENLLSALLMVYGIRLVSALEENPYSDEAVLTARILSIKARQYLAAIMIANMALNIAQLLFAYELYNVDARIRVPVFSMALCFGCMTLTRLLIQGKQIQEENDLYI